MKYPAGPLEHEKLLAGVELYGSKVIPQVRDLPVREKIDTRRSFGK
jgi:hypothetical protein